METRSRQFLEQLLNVPSPSGYEEEIQTIVREYCGSFADQIETDWHGNVMAAVNPSGQPRIMLDAHCDQIGFVVKFIDGDGFLRVSPIGGWDVQTLIGQKMQVWTSQGPILGVIARKAIHLLTPEERKQVPTVNDLWIDIGVNSKEETRELVQIGDPVTLKLGHDSMRNGLICGPGMDDRVGVWVVISALERVSRLNPAAAVFSVSSVQEEIGLRGAKTSAFSIDPQLGIAVDVTHATDCPTIDKNEHGDIQIGQGPVVVRGPNSNPRVFERLRRIAAESDIPMQVNALGKPASNNGNAIQISRGGVATSIVAIPNRYMHSPVEVVSESDLDHAAELLAQFCASVGPDCDFTPGMASGSA